MLRSLADLRVLVAEDESLVALDVESMLQDFGCEVIGPVSSVEEAEDRAREERIDGAILDVNLRGQDCFGIADQLLSRGVPVILASGYSEADRFPERFRNLPRLTKPYDEASLAEAMRSAFIAAS